MNAPDRRIAAAIVAIVALRIALLVASQHSICGDEATVGVMAREILEKHARPVFAYHEHYNGGSAFTAYLAAASFAAFGVSETALKAVPLALSILALVAVARLVRAAEGAAAALVCTLLYGTSVCLMKWNFDARGGYAEGQVLVPMILGLLYVGCLGPGTARVASAAGLGLLCGLGFYLFPLMLPAGATALVFLAIRARRFGGWAAVPAFLVGTALGAAPLWYFGADLSPLGGEHALAGLRYLPATAWATVSRYLPGTMSYLNLDDMPPVRLAPNLIEYAGLLAGAGTAVAIRRADVARFARRLLRPAPEADGREPLALLLSAYVLVYLGPFALHPLAGAEARHLVFLEPALSILTGLGLFAAWRGGSRGVRAAAVVIAAIVAGDRIVQHARLFADRGVYGPLGRSEPAAVDGVIAFLDAERVDRVMSEDWDLSWRIVFKTAGRITASHSDLWLGRLLREYRERHGELYAVIVSDAEGAQAHVRKLIAREAGIGPHRVGNADVYLLREAAPRLGGVAP